MVCLRVNKKIRVFNYFNHFRDLEYANSDTNKDVIPVQSPYGKEGSDTKFKKNKKTENRSFEVFLRLEI